MRDLVEVVDHWSSGTAEWKSIQYEEVKGERERGTGPSEKGVLEQGEQEVLLLCPTPWGKFPEGMRHQNID